MLQLPLGGVEAELVHTPYPNGVSRHCQEAAARGTRGSKRVCTEYLPYMGVTEV